MNNPEQKPIDFSGGEWVDHLTLYQTGDLVTYHDKHGEMVLTVTRVREVRPSDYKFAMHTQYVELSDRHGILEHNVSAALVQLVSKKQT